MPSNGDNSIAPPPLPPRKHATFMTKLNRKPHDRKHTLVMGDVNYDSLSGVRDTHQNVSNTVLNRLSFTYVRVAVLVPVVMVVTSALV